MYLLVEKWSTWSHSTELIEERMNNVVEIYDFSALLEVVQSHYAGEVGKLITLWCQNYPGFKVPKFVVIFRTIAKIL